MRVRFFAPSKEVDEVLPGFAESQPTHPLTAWPERLSLRCSLFHLIKFLFLNVLDGLVSLVRRQTEESRDGSTAQTDSR